MTRYQAFEMWAAVNEAFLEANRPLLYAHPDDPDGVIDSKTLSVGLPAEFLDDAGVSVGANELVERYGVGHPHEVFVHAGDLVALTGCSEETGQNWLEKFHDRGLLALHGEGEDLIDGQSRTVRLYRPIRESREETMRVLYELDRGTYPDVLGDLTDVKPSQFRHLEGSQFVFEDDESVVIDVAQSKGSTESLQDYISNQLHEYGLTPSSRRNFVYSLRSEAGLI